MWNAKEDGRKQQAGILQTEDSLMKSTPQNNTFENLETSSSIGSRGQNSASENTSITQDSSRRRVVTFDLNRNELYEVFKAQTITFEDIVEANEVPEEIQESVKPNEIEIVIEEPVSDSQIKTISERLINFSQIRNMFDSGGLETEFKSQGPDMRNFPRIKDNPFIKNDKSEI